MSLDLFTPWQEAAEQLEMRTVEREDALQWLISACEAHLMGKRPSAALVVGARGMGKSHLLAVVRARLSKPDAVSWVSEDMAASADASELWSRLWQPKDPWGFRSPAPSPERRILFIESFDCLLSALKPEGRWALRHHLQESGALLVGTAQGADFAAASDSAFFGQLDTWTLEALGPREAEQLFLQSSGARDSLNETQRETLLSLAQGNPRVLLALAQAARDIDDVALSIDEVALHAVQRLVPHYQQRWHALPPLGQQILSALTLAPRELTASEVQQQTHATSAAVSASARSLEAMGALRRHPDADDARVSRYALAEPLFRCFLEYRNGPSWASSRFAWVGRLLDACAAGPLPPSSAEEELPALLSMAHHQGDGALFARAASAMAGTAHRLPSCPKPQQPAPEPSLLLPLLGRADMGQALTWSASLAALEPALVDEGIAAIAAFKRSAPLPAEVVALLALASCSTERFEALVGTLRACSSAEVARRMLTQLRERERGPLHPELERLWQLTTSAWQRPLQNRGHAPHLGRRDTDFASVALAGESKDSSVYNQRATKRVVRT